MKRIEHENGTVEIADLTERELQILRFMVNGRCNVIDVRGVVLEEQR